METTGIVIGEEYSSLRQVNDYGYFLVTELIFKICGQPVLKAKFTVDQLIIIVYVFSSGFGYIVVSTAIEMNELESPQPRIRMSS
jgi:hypothetical protein